MRVFFSRYRSGASATGCRHEVELGERYLDLRQNPVLGEAQFQPMANGAPSILTTFFLISPLPPSLLAEDLARTAQQCYGISSYWAELPAPASTDFVRRR